MYPHVLAITQSLQMNPVRRDELQAWNYFVDHYADTDGIYYYGETKGSWLEQIPARGSHFPSLKSAILAFSSSCASHTQGTLPVDVGLNHRRTALRHLSNIMSNNVCLEKTERDAVLTKCLILRSQSFFLDDGYVDMLTLRRMTHRLAPRTQEPGHGVGDLQDGKQNSIPRTLTELQIRPEILEAAEDSIRACAGLVQDEVLSALCSLMIAAVQGLQNHPLSGLKHWSRVYSTVLDMSSADFERFIDLRQTASRIVLAHYLALLMIITAISSAASPHFGHTSTGKAAEWIEHVCWGLAGQRPDPTMIEWPLRVALLGQRARGDRPATLDNLLATLTTTTQSCFS